MNIKLTLYIVGVFLKFLGVLILLPSICSLVYSEGDLNVFLISALITTGTGFLLEAITQDTEKSKVEINRKEGFLVATLCWILAALFGSLPYLFFFNFSNPIDQIFESFAGFTTTGASVFTELENLPHGILFYRNYTQWLGGMGILVLAIAILPRLAVGGMQLIRLESSGPTMEKITPKIAETAKKLWFVYIGLSVLLMALFFICGMPIFDSIVNSFTTLSIGGFTIKSGSIGGYDSALIEAVTTLFMFIAGINFVLLYSFFIKRDSKIFRSSELKLYLFLTILFILLGTVSLWQSNYYGLLESLRYSSFQVVSIITTTGFSSENYDLWPRFIVFGLFALMFVGGCAGSTCGSIKVLRILILIKKGYREIKHHIYPRAVLPIRIDNIVVSEEIISSVISFFILYIFIFTVSVLVILTEDNVSIMTALSACAASIGNIGPGFDQVGATHNYQFLSGFSKLFLCLLMLLGRLELYTVLVLFTPTFWKK